MQQACDFFEQPQPSQLLVITFPEPPLVAVTEPPPPAPRRKPDDAPVAVATGIGWVLGGPVGAAVLGGTSYILNKAMKADGGANTNAPNPQIPMPACQEAAHHYLTHFSTLNLLALQRYEQAVRPALLEVEIRSEAPATTPQHYQLSLIRSTLDNLTQLIG